MTDFEKWRRNILKACDNKVTRWNAIGDWMYPTKNNVIYREVFEHACEEYMHSERTKGYSFNECLYCGEKVPDGIKMIALLELL